MMMKSARLPVLFSLLSLACLCLSSPALPDLKKFIKASKLDDNQAPIHLNQILPSFDSPSASNTLHSSRSIPSWDTTHLLARRLLALSTTGTLATVFQNEHDHSSTAPSDLAGIPVSLPEYIADCANDDSSPLPELLGAGNPVILALHVSTIVHNANAGSNISLSIDWWHHDNHNRHGYRSEDNIEDPFASQASLPRLSLIGTLEPLPDTMPDESRDPLEKCFLASHPDAVYWLPGNPRSPHRGYWARLVVQKALWIGGFGDRARIGWLDIDKWKAVRKSGKDGEKGWGDVRLPGEK